MELTGQLTVATTSFSAAVAKKQSLLFFQTQLDLLALHSTLLRPRLSSPPHSNLSPLNNPQTQRKQAGQDAPQRNTITMSDNERGGPEDDLSLPKGTHTLLFLFPSLPTGYYQPTNNDEQTQSNKQNIQLTATRTFSNTYSFHNSYGPKAHQRNDARRHCLCKGHTRPLDRLLRR